MRLIDHKTAQDAIEKYLLELQAEHKPFDVLNAVAVALSTVPTIDPVVRCKDCENWERDWSTLSGSSSHFCPMMDTFTEPDEFCSRAERRNDG